MVERGFGSRVTREANSKGGGHAHGYAGGKQQDQALPDWNGRGGGVRGQIAGAPVRRHGELGILKRIASSSSCADTGVLPYNAGRTPGCAHGSRANVA